MATTTSRVSGPVTFSVRSGKTLRFAVRYRDDQGTPIDISDFTGRLQMKEARPGGKVLLDVAESSTPGAIVLKTTDGDTGEDYWQVTLGKTYTSWLPPQSIAEFDIENAIDPENVINLFAAVIKVTPEAVMNATAV